MLTLDDVIFSIKAILVLMMIVAALIFVMILVAGWFERDRFDD